MQERRRKACVIDDCAIGWHHSYYFRIGVICASRKHVIISWTFGSKQIYNNIFCSFFRYYVFIQN